MSKTTEAAASCLCSAVRITATGVSHSLGACHCKTCRKWTGGPMMAVICDGVTFDGDQHVSVFDSSEWADRGFCSKCGSHLFYRLKQEGQYIVPVGLFADDTPFVFDHQVFVDERPGYYEFANKTKDMTGKEVFEKYGAS